MNVCSCGPKDDRPATETSGPHEKGKPVDTAAIVVALQKGAEDAGDIIERTGGCANCKCCAPSFTKIKPVARELAAERKAALANGNAWTVDDQYIARRVNDALLGRR